MPPLIAKIRDLEHPSHPGSSGKYFPTVILNREDNQTNKPTAATGYGAAGATCTPCRSQGSVGNTDRQRFAQRKTFATVIKLEVMRLPDAYL